MKLHDTDDDRWSYKELVNNKVTHDKKIVNAPSQYLSYEKNILIKKMFNCETFFIGIHSL